MNMRDQRSGRRVASAAAAVVFACVSWGWSGTAASADLGNGRTLYMQHCAGCHGANGISVMPLAPHFARNERLFQPDMALVAAIRSGRGAMPAYAGMLTDKDLFDVVAYLRTFRP